MGRGKEAAEMLKSRAEQEQERVAEIGRLQMLAEQNRPRNWDRLVAALQRDVAEFAENFARAKTQNLRADKLNENNLTISTQVQPILKIEVLRDYRKPGVHAQITQQSGWEFRESVTPYYQFTVEGFTNGSRAFSPEELADGIFEVVTEFFKQ